MTLKDVEPLSLWEHAAESGRFAEYSSIASAGWPWNLVGKGLLSCLTLAGGVADVAQVGRWSDSPAQHFQAAEVSRSIDADSVQAAAPFDQLPLEIIE